MVINDLSPDLILTDGRFYTLDAQNAVAQAVAIKDGRIVAVGGNAEIEELAGLITAGDLARRQHGRSPACSTATST